MKDAPAENPSHAREPAGHADVATFDPAGAAVWAGVGETLARVRRLLDLPDCPQPAVLSGADWFARLERVLHALAPIERASVKIASLGRDGLHDPWRCCPAEVFLQRMRTAWLPAMLNAEAFEMHYQPIALVDGRATFAFEALIRGRTPERAITGLEILDASRAHDALLQFDQRARSRALREGGAKLRGEEMLFINFLPLLMYDEAHGRRVEWDVLARSGLNPRRVCFEVVESEQFPDLRQVRRVVDVFREHGARIALDDLGTGHAALSYIDELQPDYIKLAKGLIPLQPRQEDLLLVRGLVDHAHLRGIRVIAEGIETWRQFEAAEALEVDLVQGWLVGAPAAEPERNLGIRPDRSAA